MDAVASPGRPHGVSADETRRRILDAALHEFGQRGYSGTSIASIARTASLTAPAVRYHFDTKLALYEAVSGRTLPAVWTQLGDAADRSETFVDALEAVLRAAFNGAVSSDEARFLTVMPVDARLDPDLSHLLSERAAIHDEVVDRLVRLGARTGELAGLSHDVAADLLRSLLIGVFIESYHRHGDRHRLLTSIVEGLRAVLPAGR